MQRRTLLQMMMAGAIMSSLPLSLHALARSGPRILVLVELSGGNDSLNTLIPLEQLDTYQSLRPKVGLANDERLTLDERFAVHQALEPLLPIWKNGDLALVHGLGYPKPNRSHFRGIEIWDTASASDEYLNRGWAADGMRAISNAPVDALVFGRNAAPVMAGQARYLHLASIEQFSNQGENLKGTRLPEDNAALRHLAGLYNDLSAGAEYLIPAVKEGPALQTEFPQTEFGRHLADVARVIRLDLGIPMFKVALGGFDTHRSQKHIHARLLAELAEGLAAFQTEMEEAGAWDRVAVMTYSEFGRRSAENGSSGTDHGTAATHFVMGGAVKGGHVGEHPDLNNLLNGDMRYSTDFRSLYQTMLSEWWRHDELQVPGGEWETLPLFRS